MVRSSKTDGQPSSGIENRLKTAGLAGRKTSQCSIAVVKFRQHKVQQPASEKPEMEQIADCCEVVAKQPATVRWMWVRILRSASVGLKMLRSYIVDDGNNKPVPIVAAARVVDAGDEVWCTTAAPYLLAFS